ncbi:pirin family protein [Halomicronema sp. CCY15110]|uniref:pirin family protein n=1 Tax=Halomicronema sp. CCY15110 TaxID=2767773 RepID=UPI0019529FF5
MTHSIQTIITPHVQDLGGFEARRLLPSEVRTMVGPFIFFDHLGPAIFPPGKGVDVRPHPHINLATVTYLFEGAILHRDSLGTIQEIRPGAVNWMTAGKGISHSERSPDAERVAESTLHGIQTWVALPDGQEEVAPCFHHHPAADIPTWEEEGVTVTLVAGAAGDRASPVQSLSPILYLDLQFAAGGKFSLAADYSERAVYSVTAGLTIDGEPLEQHRLAVLKPHQVVTVAAEDAARGIIIGGDPLGTRHKWWNFVSSRLERIEQAKQDWQDAKFGSVPEETEYIPLPE